MRWWTIIVSVGLHALIALSLARSHFAIASAQAQPSSALEVAMIDLPPAPPPEPTRAAPAPADTESGASLPPAPAQRRTVETAAAAPDALASLAPEAGSAPPGPEASRSLGMRPALPDSPAVPDGPGLDLRMPSAGAAAHAFGLSVGAPVVNMAGPERPVGGRGDSALGRPVGGGRYQKDKLQFKAGIDSDGTVHFRDAPSWQGELMADPIQGVGYRASFDITDQLMRMHGEDPYWAAKLRFLDETRDERIAMALAKRGERVREAIGRLSAVLDALWSEPSWPATQRRQLLFQLWDECIEDGDDELVRAGSEARLTIEAFVRRRLPRGSVDGFADDELERLNGSRESKAEFRPYDSDGGE